MNRNDIKIVEFGMDGEEMPAPTEAGGTIKVVEFDNDREDGPKRVVTAADVGSIKIIEFDDNGKAVASRGPDRRPEPATESKPSRTAVGPIKIVEFDKDGEGHETAGGAAKIKILEFD